MTPEEALALAKTVRDHHAQATTHLVRVVARAIDRGVDAPDWAVTALRDQLRVRREADRIITALRTATATQVPGLLAQVWSAQTSTVNPRATVALAADTLRLLDQTYPAVLRWTEDIYRAVVSETLGPAAAGVETRRQAAARVLDRLTASGVTGFTDAQGRGWRLDTYAEMTTRTALGRTHLAATLDQYATDGRDYVVVSDSPEECPMCRPFEGKVLSLGPDLPPPDLGGLVYGGTHAAATAAGLHHPNCTHRIGAYIPGLTRPFGDTESPDGYALRQRQRELERRVRDSRRRVEGLRPLGPTPALARQRALLARRRDALDGFVAEHDRKAYVARQRSSLGPR